MPVSQANLRLLQLPARASLEMVRASSTGTDMPRTPGRSFALALGMVAFIGPLAVHLFFPAIPAVKAAFGLSDALAQFTFSIAVFGMGVATLVYGTLADRLGRRPVLLSGLMLFLVGTVASATAVNVPMLVLGRLVQAVGAGCGLTLVRTIARDAYGPERLVKAIAYLTMFYAIGPLIAPAAGGVLVDAFGWRSVFAFALVAGAAITATVYAVVYETKPAAAAASPAGGVLRGYGELLAQPRFIALVLQTGFATATFLIVGSASATLMKELLGRPATEFGLYFVLLPLGFMSGTMVSSRLGNRARTEVMVLAGALLCLAAVAVQTALLLTLPPAPLMFFLPGAVVTMSQGIALPYAQAGAMATIPRLAGTAAGIGVFVQQVAGALFAQLYGIIADGTPRPMIIATGLSAALGVAAGAAAYLAHVPAKWTPVRR
jgi:DHA1 family bicyclomycin/chloramphenicol resistance-like MFS transporter